MKKSLLLAALALAGFAVSGHAQDSRSTYVQPETSTADAPKYYRIVSNRAATSTGYPGKYLQAVGDDAGSITDVGNDHYRAYWWFEDAGNGAAYIRSMITGYKLTNDGSWVHMTETGTPFYFINVTGQDGIAVENTFAISTTNPLGEESCLDQSNNTNAGNGHHGASICWSPVRESAGDSNNGSAWYFELASDEEVAAAKAAYNAAYNSYKAQGDLIAAISGMPAERKTAWETATASLTEASVENYALLKAAYGALVDGLHVKFRSCKSGCENDWLSQKDGIPQRWIGGEDCRIFTLKNAGGDGFYVLNEYLQQYIVHPTENNHPASFNADINSATVYNIDIYQSNETDHTLTMYGVFSTESGLAADQKYWHSNGSNELWRWQADRNSAWYVSFATEDEAVNENWTGARNIEPTVPANGTIGENLGEYRLSEEYKTCLANADAATTTDQKLATATALRRVIPGAYINVPSGYYHIRNVGANKLLTSDIKRFDNSTNRLILVESGNLSNTIWYYDAIDKRLVAFANGLCLGKFDSQDLNTSWATVLNSDAKVGDVTFTDCGADGKFSMFTQGGTRRIFGNTTKTVDNVSYTVIDAGGNDADNSRWELEPVTWLPMPYNENVGYLTIYSPAPLYMTDHPNGAGAQRVKPYVGTISGDKLVKTEISGNVIPANTPVLLEFLNPAGTNHIENGHIFVEIAGPAVSAAAPAADAEASYGLRGGIYATEKTAGTNYYLVGKPEGSDASFVKDNADNNVPGFVAHLEVIPEAGATAPASFLISDPVSDSITEIEGAANSGKQVIYDLQGRRVQRASKGLYIINGVKTLVK